MTATDAHAKLGIKFSELDEHCHTQIYNNSETV